MQHSTHTDRRGIALFVTLVLATIVQCSSSGNRLSGTEVVNEKIVVEVKLADGRAAGGTTVFAVDRASNPLSPSVDSMLTDEAGVAYFTNLKDGRYALSLHHSNYAAFKDSVPTVATNEDTLRITLGLRGFIRIVPGAATEITRATVDKTPFSHAIEPGTPVLFDRLSEGEYRVLLSDAQGTIVREIPASVRGADTTHVTLD